MNHNDKQSKGTYCVSLFIDRTRLCALILLQLNILLKKFKTKPKKNQYAQII